MDPPAARLGRYELVRWIGRGGAGEVWEAVQHGPHGFRKPVALKRLRKDYTSPRTVRALAEEARVGALLHHPNVVGTLALEEIDGEWCVAMELVRGPSLADLVAQAPLPPSVVVEVGVQVCAGLHHVHRHGAQGLVHRDVKPANLLVDRTGLVKIADLGIAMFTGLARGVAGTPGFMPPEQARAERVDARADLYALGVTLAALALGQPPDAAAHTWGDDLPDARVAAAEAVGAAVPGLGPIVDRCLAAEPDDRWPDAVALADALRRVAARHATGPTLLEELATRRPELGPERVTTTRVADDPLPPERDVFLGRDAEVAALVERMVSGARLTTLVGPGGIGKTRIALRAAALARPRLPGGCWFVDLSDASSVETMCSAVAHALGLALEAADPVAQIGRAVRARGRAVVVLDNLEQVASLAPGTVSRWVAAAPIARFVCTSRVPLKVRSEHVIPVGPLDPEAGLRLFLDRAPRPPSAGQLDDVRAIVEHVEGSPLAIELAAARTRVLPIAEVRQRLADQLRLLAGGGADRPERLRSLRASLDQSWRLLSDPDRLALARLSVFEGGSSEAAAEAVIELASGIGALERLADASLVRVNPESRRFWLPTVVHAYARGALADDERERAERRHGAWFAQLGSRDALAALHRRGGSARWEALAVDRDNLAVAARRAVARGDGPTAAACALALAEVVERRGPHALAIELLEAALPLAADRRIEVLHALGHALLEAGRTAEAERVLASAEAPELRSELGRIRHLQGRSDEALAWWSDDAARARAQGDRGREAVASSRIGAVRLARGDTAGALEAWADALMCARAHGDDRTQARVSVNLGIAYRVQQRFDEALASFAAAARATEGDRAFEAIVLRNVGVTQRAAGRLDEAEVALARALGIFRELGSRRSEGLASIDLAVVRASQGRRAEAIDLFGPALEIVRETGDRELLCSALGDLGLALIEDGRLSEATAPLEESLALARAGGWRSKEAYALLHLGLVRQRTGAEGAADLLERASALAREARLPNVEAAASAALGGRHG